MKINQYKILIIALVIIIFGVSGYLIKYIEPKVIITAKISDISDEDFNKILLRDDIGKYSKNKKDYRQVTISANMKGPIFLFNKKMLYLESLDKIFTKDKSIKVLGGGSLEDNFKLNYEYNIQLFLDGISENELKTKIGELKVESSWSTLGDKKQKRTYYLKDYLN